MFLKDRINIGSLLPQSGGILEQMTGRDILKKVEITEKERLELKLKSDRDLITWDITKDTGIDVDFSPTEIHFLKDQIDILDKEKKITQDILNICLLIKEQK